MGSKLFFSYYVRECVDGPPTHSLEKFIYFFLPPSPSRLERVRRDTRYSMMYNLITSLSIVQNHNQITLLILMWPFLASLYNSHGVGT